MSTQESTQQPSYHVTAQQPLLPPPAPADADSSVDGESQNGPNGAGDSAHSRLDGELLETQEQGEGRIQVVVKHGPALSSAERTGEPPENSERLVGHFNVGDGDRGVETPTGPTQPTWRTRSSPARVSKRTAASMLSIRQSQDMDELDDSTDIEIPPDAPQQETETPPHVPTPPASDGDPQEAEAGPSTPPRQQIGHAISSIRHSRSNSRTKSASRNARARDQLSPSERALEPIAKRRPEPPRRIFGRTTSRSSKQPQMSEEESFAGPPVPVKPDAPFERFDRFLKNSTSVVVDHESAEVNGEESSESAVRSDAGGLEMHVETTAAESLLFADGFAAGTVTPKGAYPVEHIRNVQSDLSRSTPRGQHEDGGSRTATGKDVSRISPTVNASKARFATLPSSSGPTDSAGPSELFSPQSRAFTSQESHNSVLFPATQLVSPPPSQGIGAKSVLDPERAGNLATAEQPKRAASSSNSAQPNSALSSVPKHRMLSRVNPRSDEESGYLTHRTTNSSAPSRSVKNSSRPARNTYPEPRVGPVAQQMYQDTQIDKTHMDQGTHQDSSPPPGEIADPSPANEGYIENPRISLNDPTQPDSPVQSVRTPPRLLSQPVAPSPPAPNTVLPPPQTDLTLQILPPPGPTPKRYGKGKRKPVSTPTSHLSNSQDSSPAPDDPEDNTYRPPAKKAKTRPRAVMVRKRGSKSKQSSRTSGTPATSIGPTSPLTPPPSTTSPKREADRYVLALWADQKYWVGQVSGHENGLLHVTFCDGHQKFVPPDKVRNFELRAGDLVKSVGVHMPLGELEVIESWDGAKGGVKVCKDGNPVGRIPLDCIVIRQKVIMTSFDDRRVDPTRYGLNALPSFSRLSATKEQAPAQCFVNKSFMITTTSSRTSMDELRGIIATRGGVVIGDWQELFMLPEDHFGSTLKSSRAPYLVVRGVQEAMKPKMMVALARGIPCLAEQYLLDIGRGLDVDWKNYLVSPGRSEVLGQHTSQIVNLHWGGPNWSHTTSENLRQPFKGKKVLFIEPRSKEERFKQVKTLVPFCLHALGTVSLNTCLTLDRDADLDVYDYIIVEDRDRSQKVAKEVIASGRMCNFQWLKQCIIMGAALEPGVFAEREPRR